MVSAPPGTPPAGRRLLAQLGHRCVPPRQPGRVTGVRPLAAADADVAMNAVLALGFIGAGTNNARWVPPQCWAAAKGLGEEARTFQPVCLHQPKAGEPAAAHAPAALCRLCQPSALKLHNRAVHAPGMPAACLSPGRAGGRCGPKHGSSCRPPVCCLAQAGRHPAQPELLLLQGAHAAVPRAHRAGKGRGRCSRKRSLLQAQRGGGAPHAACCMGAPQFVACPFSDPAAAAAPRLPPQGLVHMGKGLLTLNPYHSDHTLLNGRPSVCLGHASPARVLNPLPWPPRALRTLRALLPGLPAGALAPCQLPQLPHASGTALAGILAVLLAGGLDMKATLAVRGRCRRRGCACGQLAGQPLLALWSRAAGMQAPMLSVTQGCSTVPSHPAWPQGKQHYLLYCLTPAMKPRMLMTGAPPRFFNCC